MEAIKFSELPTGDRMPLANEDGVPIIANQENRLLTWGRLKQQLAEQTHTNEVKAEDAKVPTGGAVENRIATAESELESKLEPLKEQLTEQTSEIDKAKTAAESAKTTAENAHELATSAQGLAESVNTAAENAAEKASSAALAASKAQNTADAAKADAERFERELDGKISAISEAQANLRSDLENETTARESAITEISQSVDSVGERIGSIENKIESGEIGGGKAPEVDLTPIEKRLEALENTKADQATQLEQLSTELNAATESLKGLDTQTTELKTQIQSAKESADTANATLQNYEDRIAKLETEMTAWTDDIKLLIEQLANCLQGLNS